MPKEFRAGVSFDGDTAQIAVLEIRDQDIELRHIEVRQRQALGELWFLEGVLQLKDSTFKKISKVSVAFDHAVVFLYCFPLDTSLHQTEQNEQVHWELSNFIPNYQAKEYINDVHILRTHAREQVADVLVVAVKRATLFHTHSMLAEHKLELQIADTNYFGAENALFTNYPELKSKSVALVSTSKNRVDVGLLKNGRLTHYHYAMISPQECSKFLKDAIQNFLVSDIIFYGSGITVELVKTLREELGINSIILNPFRRVHIDPSLTAFDKFIGYEHQFAACVGCALRNP